MDLETVRRILVAYAITLCSWRLRNHSLRGLYSTTWGCWRGVFRGGLAPWHFWGTQFLKTLEAC